MGSSSERPGMVEADKVFVCKAERFGRLRADERGVVPSELGEGIGKLLQPPVVREAAVVKRRGGEKHDLQARRSASGAKAADRAGELRQRRARLRQGFGGARRSASGAKAGERRDNLGKLAGGQQSIVEDAVPFPVELGLPQDRSPGLPHDVVAGTILPPDHQPQHFDGGSSAEQREDQRLDDAERASHRARVSPRFEVMRAGNVPGRLAGCLVDRVPERDRLRGLRHGRGEVEIGGGIEHRIAAQDRRAS